MSKNIRMLMILLLMICIVILVNNTIADDFHTSGKWGDLDWELSNGTLVISGIGDMKSYQTIDSTEGWKQHKEIITNINILEGVTSISKYAFSGLINLTSITIPMGVERIEPMAFHYCIALPEIEIPESVTHIGYSAFDACENLTSINIPSCITSIEEGTFTDCHSLSNLLIPEHVTIIGMGAFSNCWSLESISIPESVTNIESSAFFECHNLKSISIPDNVDIKHHAFYNCPAIIYVNSNTFTAVELSKMGISWRVSGTNFNQQYVLRNNSIIGVMLCRVDNDVTSFSIPEDVVAIREGAFSECSYLNSIIIPDGITEIGRCAFQYCSNLTSIKLPDGITSIHSETFYGCSKLINVTIPNSVTTIESQAFDGCSSMKSITIPPNVTMIDSYAFRRCESLNAVWISSFHDVMGDRNDIFCEIHPDLPTIYCYEYSPAEIWAEQHGHEVILIDNLSITETTQINVSSPQTYEAGKDYQLICYNIWPAVAEKSVHFSSSEKEIATISDEGVLTAITPGVTYITLTVNDISETVMVYITKELIHATDFTLPDVWVVARQTEQAILENVKPDNADLDLSWSVGSTTYAQVDENGLVTGGALGETTITVKDNISGISKTATVFTRRPVTSIEFSEAKIVEYNKTIQLTANVIMGNQTCENHLVKFSSSDTTVVSVNRYGIVTCHKIGEVIITATAVNDETISASCIFINGWENVLELPASIEVIESKALAELPNIQAVRLPPRTISIEADAFDQDVILIIPSGSEWKQWAIDHGYVFAEE